MLDVDSAEVVLCLEVDVSTENRSRFLDFCRDAFPVYESVGGCRMALYESLPGSGHFNEVGYYATQADYERGERAIKTDPAQIELIERWRSLLKMGPTVKVYRKVTVRR